MLQEVGVGGGQRHVDDGELSRRLPQSLGSFQLPKRVSLTLILVYVPPPSKSHPIRGHRVFANVHYLRLIRLQGLAVAAHFTIEVAQLLCERHAVMGAAGLIPAQLLLQFTALIRCIVGGKKNK